MANWQPSVLAALLATIWLCGTAMCQPLPAQELLQASERGDTAAIRRLLAAGTPPDPVDAARQTPLLIAVQKNNLEGAKLLIDGGANINAQASQHRIRRGFWPAHSAARRCCD